MAKLIYHACPSERLAQLTRGLRLHKTFHAGVLRQFLSTQASDPLYRTKSPILHTWKLELSWWTLVPGQEHNDPSSGSTLTKCKFQVYPGKLKTPTVIVNFRLHVNLLQVSTWKPTYQPSKVTCLKPLHGKTEQS